MSFSNYAETLAIDFLFNTQTATRPTTWFVALHTADPGEAGTTAEVSTSGTAYVRKAVTFGAASSGSATNTGVVTYDTATASWGTVTHASIWTASSGGNCLATGSLASSAAVGTGTTYLFAIGTLTVSLD